MNEEAQRLLSNFVKQNWPEFSDFSHASLVVNLINQGGLEPVLKLDVHQPSNYFPEYFQMPWYLELRQKEVALFNLRFPPGTSMVYNSPAYGLIPVKIKAPASFSKGVSDVLVKHDNGSESRIQINRLSELNVLTKSDSEIT